LNITSAGVDSPVLVDLSSITEVTIIPIEVSFSATTSGSEGANRGVEGIAFTLKTSLPLIDQMPMTLARFCCPEDSRGLRWAGDAEKLVVFCVFNRTDLPVAAYFT